MTEGNILGVADVLAGLLILWCALQITDQPGLRTVEGRWSLYKSIVYAMLVIALFGLGVRRLFGIIWLDWMNTVLSLMLLFGLCYFPFLRACGVISRSKLLREWWVPPFGQRPRDKKRR
jgi:chromate transport protein ChrA